MARNKRIPLLLGLLGGGASFNPLSISGVYWYDPRRGLYQDSALTTPATAENATVGGVVEQSGSGANGSAAGAARPILKLSGFGAGLPALSYDGSGTYLDISGLASLLTGTGKPYTTVIAAKFASVATFRVLFGAGNTGDGTPYIWNGCDNATKWTARRRGGVTTTIASTTASDTDTHVFTTTYNPTTGKLTLRVNGALAIDNQDMAQGSPSLNTVAIGAYVALAANFVMTGLVGDVMFLPRVATAAEISALEAFVAPRCGVAYPFDVLDIDTPAAYQVIQRTGTAADIAISGTILATGAHDVEARWNGGAWETIDTTATGSYSGTLSAQAQGQGTLEVRLTDYVDRSRSVANIGVGDVFVIAGQSNASGRGTNSQTYSHATLKAGLFKNAYTWIELADPTDSATGQIDTVSSDTSPAAAGSIWPLLATLHMADQGVPVAFVPTAKGGTSITSWVPGGDHADRATLYGSMKYRASVTGAKAVLWWLGETDAINAMDQVTFNGHLDTIANAVQTDLGVKLMACKLQNCTGIADANEAAINAAIAEAWGDNANVLTGPDLSDIASDDSYHLMTDAKLLEAATRWWMAMDAALYP
jgi:hypothetical protein